MTSDCASRAKYKVGEKVGIYYDPDDPGEALIDALGKFTNMMIAGVGLALLLWLVAWFFFRRAWRQSAAEG